MKQDNDLKIARLALLGCMFATTWDCFLIWVISEANSKQDKLELVPYLIISIICTVLISYIFINEYEKHRK